MRAIVGVIVAIAAATFIATSLATGTVLAVTPTAVTAGHAR